MTATDPTARPDGGQPDEGRRDGSFGQDHELTPIDRLGVWLSRRSILRHVGSFAGRRVIDVGCGFEASFARTVRDEVAALTLVDLQLAPDLLADPRITTIEGPLPTSLDAVEDGSCDVTMCMSVVEHVWDDLALVEGLRRVTAPGGVAVINVPSWLGKRALELSAFRLGLSPAAEMNDHKRYYDPKDLWPLLVRAGFVPQHISCRRHKAGLNTIAVCTIPGGDTP